MAENGTVKVEKIPPSGNPVEMPAANLRHCSNLIQVINAPFDQGNSDIR